MISIHVEMMSSVKKKSASVDADLLDTNKDIDSKKYLFP